MKIYCCYCEKLINDTKDADWGLVSHGICPECYKVEMDKLDKEDADDKKRKETQEKN